MINEQPDYGCKTESSNFDLDIRFVRYMPLNKWA